MECRKARYYLVASFDGTLDPEVKKQLGYHLKDCRACRHESFYYRELFSAERQLEELQPGADFNAKLVARIRLREAQAAWPERAPHGARSRRSVWVLAPGLFAAAAALAFVFLIGPAEPEHAAQTPGTVDRALPAAQGTSTASVASTDGIIDAIPRYAPGWSATARPRGTEEIFRVQYSEATDASMDDAFARPFEEALRSEFARSLPSYRSQERMNYVLPVLHHGDSQEHIY
jgi:hypothetical protein